MDCPELMSTCSVEALQAIPILLLTFSSSAVRVFYHSLRFFRVPVRSSRNHVNVTDSKIMAEAIAINRFSTRRRYRFIAGNQLVPDE